MELIKIEHEDFILHVITEDNAYNSKLKVAAQRMKIFSSSTLYQTTDDCKIFIYYPSIGITEIEQTKEYHPIFFENILYKIKTNFRYELKEFKLLSKNKKIEEISDISKDRYSIYTPIKWTNFIGQSEYTFLYLIDGKQKQFSLRFEVFPLKMNYKEDFRNIINEINNYCSLLSFDYITNTHISIKLDINQKKDISYDLLWINIFTEISNAFLSACEYVVKHPKSHLVKIEKVDRLSKTHKIPNTFHRELIDQDCYILSDHKVRSIDTPENRFVKKIILEISNKFLLIQNLVKLTSKENDQSCLLKENINNIQERLLKLKKSSFYKNIGNTNLICNNLILQKAVGYSLIYKYWISLQKSCSLAEDIFSIQLKSIDKLYEIWCFIKIKEIIENILDRDSLPVSNTSKEFIHTLKTGRQSILKYIQNNVEISLLYNPIIQRSRTSIDSLYSLTLPQKPDIILQIVKKENGKNYTFRYIFDAKYRIEENNNIDYPPDEAINQMHRYRDALIMIDEQTNDMYRIINGCFVLFPSKDSKYTILEQNYYKSIFKVDIGAFPLIPSNNDGIMLLQEKIKTIIESSSKSLLNTQINYKYQ